MNQPMDPQLLQPAEAFAHYLKNTAARIDEGGEADALRQGARVGISRPHESAHLHVAGEASYIDDLPELDAADAEREVVAAALRLVRRVPALRHIVLECTNLPPYAQAVREATGLPVHHLMTLVHERYAAL